MMSQSQRSQRNPPAPASGVIKDELAYLGALSGQAKSLLVAAGVFLVVLLLPGTITLRLLGLFVAAGLTWYAAVKNSFPPVPLKTPALLWTAIAVLSLSWAVDPAYSFGEIKSEILYPALAFLVFFGATRTRAELRLWLYLLFAAVVLMSIAAIVLWRLGDNTSSVRFLYAGVGSYTTFVVTMFPFAVLVLLRLMPRKLIYTPLWLLLPLLLVAAYLTYNRTFWIALAGSSLVLLTLLAMRTRVSRKRIPLVVSIVLIVAVSATAFYEVLLYRSGATDLASVLERIANSDPRVELWKFTASEIYRNPWTGVGFGFRSFSIAYPDVAQHGFYWHPHNIFLNYGIQMGVAGIIAFSLLILAVLREFWALYTGTDSELGELGAVGAALVIGMVVKNITDSFFYRENALLFWSLVGMILGYARHKRQCLMNRVPGQQSLGDAANAGAGMKFLVIRRDNIGDLVCTTPMFRALRQRFTRASIYALVNSYNDTILERNPDIDAVYSYVKTAHHGARLRALLRRLQLLVRLRRERIDYVILAGSGSKHALKLARALRPKHIVGYAIETGNSNRAIDIEVQRPADESRLHEVELAFRLLEPLGVRGQPPAMCVFPDPDEVAAARSKLQAAGIPVTAGKKYLIGVQISSRKPVNRWPPEKFVEFMRRLHRAHGARFLLLWAPGSRDNPQHPGDDETAAEILAGAAGVPVIAYEQGPLGQLIADLSLCDWVITSDGGAMHIAAALGKPMLCFFGDAASARWRPWRSTHMLLQPSSGRVGDIGVDEAYEAFNRLVELPDRVLTSHASRA